MYSSFHEICFGARSTVCCRTGMLVTLHVDFWGDILVSSYAAPIVSSTYMVRIIAFLGGVGICISGVLEISSLLRNKYPGCNKYPGGLCMPCIEC